MENECKLTQSTIPGRPLLSAELDALAGLFENGPLEVQHDPAEFLTRVRRAIVFLYKENEQLKDTLRSAGVQGVVLNNKSTPTG